ncbi:MAG: TrmO family methyltransferase [Acidimicrobiales bacterium]
MGREIIVLTWLDRARRDVLVAHPRGDPAVPERGVFSTRSPDRPNPIGVHRVQIVSIDGTRLLCATWRRSTRRPSSTSNPYSTRHTRRRSAAKRASSTAVELRSVCAAQEMMH